MFRCLSILCRTASHQDVSKNKNIKHVCSLSILMVNFQVDLG